MNASTEQQTQQEESSVIPFVSGHTELNYGILHLFRDLQPLYSSALGSTDLQQYHQPISPQQLEPSPVNFDQLPYHGTLLCILAVPIYMTSSDFLTFLGPSRSMVSHVRILRDKQPNRYMQLSTLILRRIDLCNYLLYTSHTNFY
jgi:BRCA1-associated protein